MAHLCSMVAIDDPSLLDRLGSSIRPELGRGSEAMTDPKKIKAKAQKVWDDYFLSGRTGPDLVDHIAQGILEYGESEYQRGYENGRREIEREQI